MLGRDAADSARRCAARGCGVAEQWTSRGEKFVAIGTSISMGWASNGVYAASQLVSWPELLSFGQLHPISLPLIQSPGCTSPLVAPLGNNKRLSGEPFSGSAVCAPNVAGVTLPTQDVALAGAITIDALQRKPEDPGTFPWYSRVLPPGMTQVTAALAQRPTFVSVELGGNDVLATTGGLVVPGVTYVPFQFFAPAFGAVISAVASVPKGLILALPTDGSRLPALRRGDEIWADRAEFAQLHVNVSQDCMNSPNYINVSLKALEVVFEAASSGSAAFSCADVPGTEDRVLTPTDIGTLNGLLVQMEGLAKQEAADHGYAFVSLGVLYDRPDLKPRRYSVISQLTSPFPYGFFISLDGVHPSPLGHAVIALAAAQAINDTYRSTSAHTFASAAEPSLAERLVEPPLPFMALEWAKQMAMEHRGDRLPACMIPGGCFVGGSIRQR